jgi:ectoine hydroxylase-related dioxygenase (phytanoyl-CoA dioxygenase family)
MARSFPWSGWALGSCSTSAMKARAVDAVVRAVFDEGVRLVEIESWSAEIEVNAGGASFHHHLTFHGSGPNTAAIHRRACISHLIPADAEFHSVNVDPTYSRYRRIDDMALDESFFPVVWTRDAGRSAWLDAQLPEHVGGVLAQGRH